MSEEAAQRAIARARHRLREAGRLRSFARRETLMAVGDRVDEVVLIESGIVKVILPSSTGSDVVTGLWGPGELLGELGVLHFRARSATVIGHLGGVATHVGGAVFRELAYHDRDVHAFVDTTQRRRLHNADRRQLAVASLDVMSRVISQLCEWAENFGERVNGQLVVRGLSHRDLAGAVLASEKHVDAVLRDLRAIGQVRTGRMCFILLDPARLANSVRFDGPHAIGPSSGIPGERNSPNRQTPSIRRDHTAERGGTDGLDAGQPGTARSRRHRIG